MQQYLVDLCERNTLVSSSNGVSDSSLEPLFDGKWWPWVVTYLTSLLIN